MSAIWACFMWVMPLADIVNVQITAATISPTRPGFGTPLIAANTVPVSFGNARVRKYGSLGEMISAGFLVSNPAYQAAQAIKSQTPSPTYIKVGRRALKTVQSVTLTVTSAVEGDLYSADFRGADQTPFTTLFLATPNGTNTTTMAATLVVPIDALPGLAATSATNVITIVPSGGAGKLFDVRNWTGPYHLADNTADPGIATDLAAIRAEDSDWYGLILDSNSKAEVVAAAAWCETQRVIFVANSSDYAVKDPASTTDVGFLLKNSSYARTVLLFQGNALLGYSGAAWMGDRFPQAPGSDTWMFKNLKGVAGDLTLQDGDIEALFDKNVNVYTPIAGVNITQNGTSASGAFADVTRFVDWLKAEIETRIVGALINLQKVPYTDKGVAMIVSIIKGALSDGVTVGGLSPDPEPQVFAPKVADVDPTTRGTRLLPNVTFQANLASAIHGVVPITGTVSV